MLVHPGSSFTESGVFYIKVLDSNELKWSIQVKGSVKDNKLVCSNQWSYGRVLSISNVTDMRYTGPQRISTSYMFIVSGSLCACVCGGGGGAFTPLGCITFAALVSFVAKNNATKSSRVAF